VRRGGAAEVPGGEQGRPRQVPGAHRRLPVVLLPRPQRHLQDAILLETEGTGRPASQIAVRARASSELHVFCRSTLVLNKIGCMLRIINGSVQQREISGAKHDRVVLTVVYMVIFRYI